MQPTGFSGIKSASAFLLILATATAVQSRDEIRYGRDVKPILARTCFACHGPDEKSREADLRLDELGSAVDTGAIVPGKPSDSELIKRIESTDDDEKMPPAESGESLTKAETEILKAWIKQGARYERHWAFELPRKTDVPGVKDKKWPLNSIDFFVLNKLEEKGLSKSPAADRLAWIRRVALDVTGLPPERKLVQDFLDDKSSKAFERVVNRLLAADSFGEHWARMWLDLARYADTRGYEKDRHRDIWRYRDWVIAALNADMPFDQFTREQLAGDLLPDRTDSQILATAFHRNTMTNEEGGTDNEEFRVAAVKDRVDTTIQVWMGLTMGCAKCHSHKYDPISLKDYYSFYAFFNQTQDNDNEGPYWPTPTPEQTTKIDELKQQISENLKQIDLGSDEFKQKFQQWKKQFDEQPLWIALKLLSFESRNKVELVQNKNGVIVAGGKRPDKDTWSLTFDLSESEELTSLRVEHFPKSDGGGEWPDANVAIQEIEVELLDKTGKKRKLKLKNPRASFSQRGWEIQKAVDGNQKVGWALSPNFAKKQVAIFDFPKPTSGSKLVVKLVQEYGQGLLLARSRFSVSSRPANWNLPSVDTKLESVFAKEIYAPYRDAYRKVEKFKQNLAAVQKSIPKTPVMLELDAKKQRVTKIHRRGNFLEPTDKVDAEVMSIFGKLPAKSSRNRLGVADWISSPENPLTARVMVNRIWARLFGTGIVETEEDFGTQGTLPSHPELLDWLAVDFRENGWSVKRLIKQMVLSQTYRQSSRSSAEQIRQDPRNRWLGRGPRFRLSAEMVRDQALAAAGMLNQKIGGPSVMPPQPDGIWKTTYSGLSWKNATGPDRYRRAIYTYLKRTSPYPAMQTFDAGSGEVCQIRRIRTNTPLQALVVLNDQAYFEAAGGLAQRMSESSTELKEQLSHGFRRLLIRKPDPGELNRLVKLYQSIEIDEKESQLLLKEAGLKTGDPKLVLVANVLLNLDETLTK